MAPSHTDTLVDATLPAPADPGAPPPPPHDPSVPRRIGRFAILRPLGAGGMGVVYAGFDEELDRRVAIKLLQATGGDTSQGHARLLREAQAMARLAHPNICTVFEVGTWDAQVFMAMEYLSGRTLRQWIAAGPHPWPAVLDVLTQAGRGLAAAHAAGLVHRDFKPDNAVVGDDQRVRVLDFGLARAADDRTLRPTDAPVPKDSPDIHVSHSALAAHLTRTGAVMGTPAYMAPEQHLGQPADARADQYSFCVSLHEALYGVRPFTGDSLPNLIDAIFNARTIPPPPGRSVPAWLRTIVLRGLAVDPEDRWPSMDALLAALARDPARRRRRVLAGLGVAALAGLGLAGWWRAGALAADVCSGNMAALVGAWDDDRRAAVTAALLATDRDYAGDTATRVRAELDAYAAAWVDARRDACEATAVRREQSSDLRDRRMLCLADRREHLRATVDVLAAADPDVAARAIDAVHALPGLRACADLHWLTAAIKPPDDPAAARRVFVLQDRLAQAAANRRAGRFHLAEQILRPIVLEAADLGYAPLIVAAGALETTVLDDLGRYAEAEAAGERAYFAAGAGLEASAADLAIDMISLVGDRLARPIEGLAWSRHAWAAIRRADAPALEPRFLRERARVLRRQSDADAAIVDLRRAIDLEDADPNTTPVARATTLRHLAAALHAQGKYPEAEAAVRRALELRVSVYGPDHPTVADLHHLLGSILSARGQPGDALPELERALAMRVRDVGANHPWAGSDHLQLAAILVALGRLEEARTHLLRSLAIHEAALGPDHADVAAVHNNLGTALVRLGHHAAARTHFERALAILLRAFGEDHADVARLHANLGVLAKRDKQLEAAAAHYARALALLERRLGKDHPATARVRVNTANLRSEQGRHAEAERLHRQALASFEAALGADHPDLVLVLNNLADNARARGKPDEAVAFATRAITIAEANPDKTRLALARFALAEALGRTARARALASEARAAFVAAGQADELARVDAWLARR